MGGHAYEGRAQRVWKVWKEKDDDQADLVTTYTIKELEKIKRRILKMIRGSRISWRTPVAL